MKIKRAWKQSRILPHEFDEYTEYIHRPVHAQCETRDQRTGFTRTVPMRNARATTRQSLVSLVLSGFHGRLVSLILSGFHGLYFHLRLIFPKPIFRLHGKVHYQRAIPLLLTIIHHYIQLGGASL
jgi:hypothetical protein